MLLVALHFWNTSISSLHLKCGMFTPTLLDVAAITCLKRTGETFDPSSCKSDFSFDFDKATFGNYIIDQHIRDKKEVSKSFWLSIYVFCTRSIQVAKQYRTSAYLLHEGKLVCLRKLLLGCLYESLNQGETDIRDKVKSLIIPGPVWLFQLWFLATFRSKLDAFLPGDFEEAYKERSTE